MIEPGRIFATTSAYRYGFNGKEQDSILGGGIGIDYNYGFRIYDARVVRFFSVDQLAKKYPWYSPYEFAGNNPIVFIDIDGLEPGVKGRVPAVYVKYSDAQLKQALIERSTSIHSGISPTALVGIANQEGLTVKIYDIDGKTKYGGNATIGFGTLVHYGAIGNTYYDSKALTKEAQYSDGITFSQAIDLFINETNEQARDLNNRFTEFKIDKSLVSQDEMDVLADIYFNSGTANTKAAFAALSKNGKQGLIDAIQNGLIGKNKPGTVSSISEARKDFRLGILKNGTNGASSTSGNQPSTAQPASSAPTREPVPISNEIPGVNGNQPQ